MKFQWRFIFHLALVLLHEIHIYEKKVCRGHCSDSNLSLNVVMNDSYKHIDIGSEEPDTHELFLTLMYHCGRLVDFFDHRHLFG